MRILFVTNNYRPYSGGVVSSIDATVQELRAQGHDVLLVTLDFLGVPVNEEDYIARIACPLRFMYKNNHMALPWRPTHTLLLLAKKYAPDIIHVHHPFLLGESGLYVARTLGIACVFTYHALYEQFAHYVPVPLIWSQPIIRWMVKRFCNSVDGIIVPSNSVKTYVRAQGIISPVEVIPSPLRTPFISCDSDQVQKRDKQFFELLVVSRFAQEKNIPFVLDVFKRLPDNVRLTMVGYGAEYRNIQKLAFDVFNLSNERVRFIHKPDQSVLINVYRSADLFIFPSQVDTQGLVIVEAMSQGLPVIALDGPGQRDIICNGKNGFIVFDDEAAAVTIKRIISDNALHERLRAGARTTIERYVPKVQVDHLLSFYRSVSLF